MNLPAGFNPPYVAGLDSRQRRSVIFFVATIAAFASRDNKLPVQIPQGCMILGGSLNVLEASNDTGTATIQIGDAVDPDRYLAPTNAKAVALTPIAANARITPVRETVLVEYTPAEGDATEGEVAVVLEYIRLGRSDHTEG